MEKIDKDVVFMAPAVMPNGEGWQPVPPLLKPEEAAQYLRLNAAGCKKPLQTLRYYLSPGVCIDGICRYDFEDVVCEQGCQGNACVGDLCIGLVCEDDGNPCTDEGCDPTSGCVYTATNNPCDDGNACTNGERCANGACNPGEPLICDDDIDCTEDRCDPASGCVFNPISDRCDDSDICTDDVCDPVSGCQNTLNTAPCDDVDPCTMNDACYQGVCAGEPLDADSDGYVALECEGDDCDDTNDTVNPGALELCDGLDHNCDGLADMVGTDMCNYEAFCSGGELLFCGDAVGPVLVPTIIEEDTVWCARQSPILIEGLTVALQDAVITAGPCLEVRAEDGAEIEIRGKLLVRATPEYPSVFTSNSETPIPGNWVGINVVLDMEAETEIEGAIIEYAEIGLRGEHDQLVYEGMGNISNTVFRHNVMGLSDFFTGTGLKLEVNNSEFLQNECGCDDDHKDVRNSVFSGNDVAICDEISSGSILLSDCTITENRVGMEGQFERVEGCLIADNSELGVRFNNSGVFVNNVVRNNGIGAIVIATSASHVPGIHRNTICDNGSLDLISETSQNVDASNNWWCSTDPDFISSRIYDVYDDPSLGQVVFEPFLEEEP